MSDGLSVHCVDTTDVVAVDTAHTKDVLSADATDFMSAHTTLTLLQWIMLQKHGPSRGGDSPPAKPARFSALEGWIDALEGKICVVCADMKSVASADKTSFV